MTTHRPVWAEVDLGAIRHNAGVLAGLAQPGHLCAVVKANGYGHGAVPVARAREHLLVTGSAVAFTVGATRLVLLDRALGGVRAVRTETGVLHGLAAADGTLLELMSARAASPSGAASAPPSWVEARPFP